MKFTVTNKIFEKFPDAKFGALLIEGVDNKKQSDEIMKLLETQIKTTIEQYNNRSTKSIPQIKNWREVFKELGLNRDFLPSHEALITRVKSKNELPDINPLVNIYNIVSLKYLIPIGGHDTDKAPDIRIDRTTGQEPFQAMNSNEKIMVEPNEIAYIFKNEILTRHFVWRQSETSKTDANTKNVFIPIDNASGDMSKDKIRQVSQEIADLITKHLGGTTKFDIVDKNNTEINFDSIKPMKTSTTKPKTDKVNTDPAEIEEFLTRGVEKVVTKEELKKKMSSGKQLRAYIGYDVTGPDLHIGHGATLLKLKHWQELGHHVIALIGDDTSRIGDHSDKLEKRKRLTNKEIDHNKKQFKEQFGKILDLDKTEVRYNSEWLDNLKFRDVIELASLFSVQQLIDRENFAKRLKINKTIGLEELLYPLMQGYDSVALNVDLEMGATDQTFNLLSGRKIMQSFGMTPQCVITVPFVTGTDGRKMSKSWNNYIPMRASSNDLYGGLMASVDEVIIEYFKRLTTIPLDEIEEMEKDLDSEKVHPMELKKKLAFEVTSIYYDEKEAQKAQEHFEKTVQKGETPEKIESIEVSGKRSVIDLLKLLVEKGLISSNAEAKRLVKQGSISIDDNKINSLEEELVLKPGSVLKIGKRSFVEVK